MAKKENNELANRMNSQNYFVSSRGMARNTRHTLPKVWSYYRLAYAETRSRLIAHLV